MQILYKHHYALYYESFIFESRDNAMFALVLTDAF